MPAPSSSPRSLPIYQIEQQIVDALRSRPRLILQAPTASGKSTQVPQILLEHGLLGQGQVLILQPRRLAARLLAARVAHERGAELGREVGYQVRFEHVARPDTRIKFVTEGILLRHMVEQPALPGIQAVLFDEFHERHLYGDVTLARALALQETTRPDLILGIMSATLDPGPLERYLDPCLVLTSQGRTYPVDLEYSQEPSDRGGLPTWERAATAFARYRRSGGDGDVLIFMPGSYEIHQTLEALRQVPEAKGCLLLPLHGALAPADQDAAVARYEQPKIVVSTNVAETSVTIDGIRAVIDSGLARLPRHDPHRGINTLWIEKISRDAADQRAGRAGRTAPGRCFRLWTQAEHLERPARETPEIRRLDLSEVVLALKASGVQSLRDFRWLEPPDPERLDHAESLLSDLGALDARGRITDLGRRMLAFPVHPRYSRMLLAAEERGCVYQAALAAALTQGRELLIRQPGREISAFRESLFGDRATSDFWILMRAWSYAAKNGFRLEPCRRAGVHAQTARQVGPLLDLFLRLADRAGMDVQPHRVPDEIVQKCILTGFSDRLARRLDSGTLRSELVHGRRGNLARDSAVPNHPLFVAAEVHEIEGPHKSVETRLSLATAVEVEWLAELFPADLRQTTRVAYDPTLKRVVSEESTHFRDLLLTSRRSDSPDPEAAARALAEEILGQRLVLKHWTHGVEQWIVRLNRLGEWCPELGLPPIGREERRQLLEQICMGATAYRQIKDREVFPAVRAWLSDAQQILLDTHAPDRLRLANGRTPRVNYNTDGPPHIALRIQELYGTTDVPPIALGRVPVLVHILAPHMRPVQITQDLRGFWREHYPRLKQELQRKYPKHKWL